MGFRAWIEKQILEFKLQMMDDIWDLTGGYSWDIYPPSFYHRHTKEEAEAIMREDLKELQRIFNRLSEDQ